MIRDHLLRYADIAAGLAIQYIPQLLLALIVLWVGFKLTGIATNAAERTLAHQKVDRSLAGFLTSLISIGLKAIVLISVATMVGIQTTSLIALLGAAGLAVGLSLQGSLSNFAGGMLILLFKPFEVGHDIEAQGHRGTVERIEIFTTILRKESCIVIIPNGVLSNGVVVNHTLGG